MNFYDKLITEESKDIKYEDKIADIQKGEKKENQFVGNDSLTFEYKTMMKAISTSTKQWQDAIKTKVIQELRSFKKAHSALSKQLGGAANRKK